MSHDDLKSRLAELDKSSGTIGRRPQSIWDLLKSIHSAPVLREWVTLESSPLCPLVVRVDEEHPSSSKGATVHLLLAVPTGGSREATVFPPWAYIRWDWPSCRLLGVFDITGEIPQSDFALPRDLICTKSFAESIEAALENGGQIPLPAQTLLALYNQIIKRTPATAARRSEKRNTDSTGCAKPSESIEDARLPDSEVGIQQADNESSESCKVQIDQVETYLSRSRTIVDQVGIEEITAEWRRINSRLGMSPFSVAVVGEFSRGKSTLINSLLDQDVLPVGDTPTTATLARIRYGPKPRMFFMGGDSGREELQFGESSLDRFSGYENESTFEGFLLIELPNNWLQVSGVDLIDTPGAGDLSEKRTALVTQTIANCDAALVAINATMALSLTERAFVEEHVLSKGTPRVAVIVTRLDQIPKEQRPRVLTYVRDKLKSWAPEALVCSAQPASILEGLTQVDAAGSEEIRDLVTKWAQGNDRMALVARQVAFQLADLLEGILGIFKARETSYQLSDEKRSQLIVKAQEALDRQSLVWEDLRLKVDSLEIDLEKWLEKEVNDSRDKMLESLVFQLNHSNSPSEWWDNDLPFLMRRELQTVVRTLEIGLNDRFRQHSKWLVHEIRQHLQWELATENGSPVGASNGFDNRAIPRGITSDLSTTRYYTRIGAAVLTVGAYALVGPLAMIGGALAGVAADRYMKGKIDDQKRQLSEKLAEVVDATLSGLVNDVKSRLRSRYATLLDNTMKQESTWASTRLEALKQQSGDSQEESLSQLRNMMSETRTLHKAISDWSEGGFAR